MTLEASQLLEAVMLGPINPDLMATREQSIGEYRGLLRLGELLDAEIADVTETIKSQNLM